MRTEKGCVYDEDQELSAFYERSRLHAQLLGGDQAAKQDFERHFSEDCGKWANAFFSLFRGINPIDAEKRKELSPAEFVAYLKKSYTGQQLLGMQMFMRNEEFNEVGNRILSDLLDETE
ncbi:hypothetical protein [Ruminococcus sp.]|uniref:hypothetical protein n=1 Tax=Ruminococcus sp. TaxID=41978 RepID=UPI00388F80F6